MQDDRRRVADLEFARIGIERAEISEAALGALHLSSQVETGTERTPGTGEHDDVGAGVGLGVGAPCFSAINRQVVVWRGVRDDAPSPVSKRFLFALQSARRSIRPESRA